VTFSATQPDDAGRHATIRNGSSTTSVEVDDTCRILLRTRPARSLQRRARGFAFDDRPFRRLCTLVIDHDSWLAAVGWAGGSTHEAWTSPQIQSARARPSPDSFCGEMYAWHRSRFRFSPFSPTRELRANLACVDHSAASYCTGGSLTHLARHRPSPRIAKLNRLHDYLRLESGGSPSSLSCLPET
jgi:hypothetical protein